MDRDFQLPDSDVNRIAQAVHTEFVRERERRRARRRMLMSPRYWYRRTMFRMFGNYFIKRAGPRPHADKVFGLTSLEHHEVEAWRKRAYPFGYWHS